MRFGARVLSTKKHVFLASCQGPKIGSKNWTPKRGPHVTFSCGNTYAGKMLPFRGTLFAPQFGVAKLIKKSKIKKKVPELESIALERRWRQGTCLKFWMPFADWNQKQMTPRCQLLVTKVCFEAQGIMSLQLLTPQIRSALHYGTFKWQPFPGGFGPLFLKAPGLECKVALDCTNKLVPYVWLASPLAGLAALGALHWKSYQRMSASGVSPDLKLQVSQVFGCF